MKKAFIIVFLLFFSVFSYAQSSEGIYRVATYGERFIHKMLPRNMVRVTIDSSLYELTDSAGVGRTMTWVIANHKYKELGKNIFWQTELTNDAENDWAISNILKSTAVILYNNTPLRAAQWTGSGTTTLHVNLITRKYDNITVIN